MVGPPSSPPPSYSFFSGVLFATASEFGFDALGVDTREDVVTALGALGYTAIKADFLELTISERVDVISMADVLEHMPYPRIALAKVSLPHARFIRTGALLTGL